MEFSYGVIAAVGVLAAISIALIAMSPDEVLQPRAMQEPVRGMPEPGMPEPAPGPQVHVVTVAEGSGVPGCEADDECFLPYSVKANAGDSVLWDNIDTAAHTVTGGTPSDGADGTFDSGLLAPGGTFEFAFEEAGTYDYFCIVHPWMLGTVAVS